MHACMHMYVPHAPSFALHPRTAWGDLTDHAGRLAASISRACLTYPRRHYDASCLSASMCVPCPPINNLAWNASLRRRPRLALRASIAKRVLDTCYKHRASLPCGHATHISHTWLELAMSNQRIR